MYANLRVVVTDLETNERRTLRAWGVDLANADEALIHLDRETATQKYPEPAGRELVDLRTNAITIRADF